MADIPTNSGTTRPSNQKAATRKLVGISFPFRKENGKFPATDTDAECVQNDVFTLFNTVARSRVHRPLVGHRAHSMVFESQGALLRARLQREIRQTILNNEPRITIIAISLEQDGTAITPTVDYRVKGIRDSTNLPTLDTQ